MRLCYKDSTKFYIDLTVDFQTQPSYFVGSWDQLCITRQHTENFMIQKYYLGKIL